MYRKCEYCGASLDSAERCSCREEAEENRRKMENLYRTGEDGQMEIGGIAVGRMLL